MKENTPAAAPRAKAFDSAAYKNWARQEGASWLASRHRDASSLLAAWDLIGDATLLMEAARRFPQDRSFARRWWTI
jgi:hypothetical protein